MKYSLWLLLCVLVLLGSAGALNAAERIYHFPLDANPGWTIEGSWWFGTPPGGADPTTGHTGSYVYGTDYDSSWYWEPARYLTTTPLDCSNSTHTVLRFWRWLGILRTAVGDNAAIQVSGDGSTWTTVWNNPASYDISDNGWVQVEYDISAVADGDSSVWIRWQYGPLEDNSGAGWNVDDVEIWSGSPGPLPVYSWNLNTSPGWTTEGAWAYGTPTGNGAGCGGPDPASGHTGTNVYGYNLTGDYGNLVTPEYLTTTAIDCSTITGTTLVFWRWLNVNSAASDHALVQVSNDGSTWTTVWQNFGSVCQWHWQLCVYDISAIADGQPTVYLRWQMGPTDAVNNFPGWNIDDIQIWNGSPLTILAWTAYADLSPVGEYANTLTALESELGGGFLVQPFAATGQVAGEYLDLSRHLEGKQVFLAIEQELATAMQASTAGAEFGSALQSFASNGGTVVTCGENMGNWTGQFLTATGLMSATYLTAYGSGEALPVVADWHPLAADLGSSVTAQNATSVYTTDANTLSVIDDGSGNAVLAVRDYGAGAAIVFGSDFYTYDADAARILANAVQYPKRQGRRVLLYDDGWRHAGAEALRRLGYSYTLTGVADFDELLTTQQWDLVVVDNPSCYLGGCLEDHAYRSLSQYARAWGPSLLDTFTLESYPELAEAFGVTPVETLLSTLPPLYAWTVTPFFDTPNAVPGTLSNWLIWSTARVGNRLTVNDGEAHAGWTGSEAANEAALVVSNNGHSLVNGFLWVIANQDADENGAYDGDGVQDVVELIMNQIVYLANRPYVDMTVSPMAAAAGETVNLTARGGPEVTTWDWDSGDDNYPDGATTSHIYSTPGFYTVNVTAGAIGAPWGSGGRTGTRAVVIGFPDAAPGFWACNYIIACLEGGVVTGYYDGTYRPSSVVNRGAMAVYISRALAGGDAGVPAGPGTPTFVDVGTDHWAYKYIEYAYSEDVVTGYADNTYRPDLTVNRAAMAVYIARAISSPSERPNLPGYTPPATPTFTDVAADHWAYKFVEFAEDRAVVGGYWDGTYRPDVEVDRGGMAVYVQRAFDLWMPYS